MNNPLRYIDPTGMNASKFDEFSRDEPLGVFTDVIDSEGNLIEFIDDEKDDVIVTSSPDIPVYLNCGNVSYESGGIYFQENLYNPWMGRQVVGEKPIQPLYVEFDILLMASLIAKAIITTTARKGIQLSKGKFGHTFTNHGEKATNFTLKRAEDYVTPQGQFLNNQKAAKFILDNMDKASKRAVNIPIPKGFPARVIMPDGKFKAATHIRLIPSGSGVKTAYPLIP